MLECRENKPKEEVLNQSKEEVLNQSKEESGGSTASLGNRWEKKNLLLAFWMLSSVVEHSSARLGYVEAARTVRSNGVAARIKLIGEGQKKTTQAMV